MKQETKSYKVRNVKVNVQKAISLYCKEHGYTQATFLEKDKRIKDFLAIHK